MQFPLLLIPIIAPLIALISLATKKSNPYAASLIATLFTTLFSFLLLIFIRQAYLSIPFIPNFGISLDLSLYPYSYPLILMNSIVFLVVSIVGKYFIGDYENRLYNALFLLVQSASYGIFLSYSLFFFYLFWEVGEISMFFIIYVFGGYRRRYASIKFLVYSIFASLLLLLGFLFLYYSFSPPSFSISAMLGHLRVVNREFEIYAFILITLAFIIKLPAFPFHSWLPDAHTEAPTTGSMILAGVLLKYASYGLLLEFLIIPIAANYASFVALIFIFSSIYSGIVMITQKNIKRLIAYSSIVDMGVIGIGIAAGSLGISEGIFGSLYLMIAHAFSIAVLFLLAGTLDELFGTLEIERIKGVEHEFPSIGYLFLIGLLLAIGLPVSAGFVGDIFTFSASFAGFGIEGILPIFGILLLSSALLWSYMRCFLSTEKSKIIKYPSRSIIVGAEILIIFSFIVGIAAPYIGV
ncbi:MAG: NADH-quinone oxidoreductase subunit M [Candidatus Micrarchaeaceae archaeon]